MIKFIFIFFLLNLNLFSDELWDKAVKLLEESNNLVPEIMVVESTMKNMDGEVKNHFKITYKTFIDEKGELKTEEIQVIRDGKDITKEYKEDLEKKKKKEKEKEKKETVTLSTDDFDIFHPKNQNKLKIQRKGTENINGNEYILYDFSQKIDEKTYQKGTAYLNSQSGCPYKVILSQEPLPKYTKEMKTTLIYKEIAKGKVVLSEMVFEGWGSFLFYKRRFEAKTSFDKYFEYSKNKQ